MVSINKVKATVNSIYGETFKEEFEKEAQGK